EVWDRISFDSMEKELVEQYKNSNNVNIRIHLHEKYSQNPLSWFEWLYQQYELKEGMKIMEIGCGNGQLWSINQDKLDGLEIVLSDVSLGMLNDAFKNLSHIENITYQCFDAQQIPFSNETFDIVIANHVLFYVADISQALKEIKRVLKPDGKLYASTYGIKHMKEITELVKEFDPKITLSNVALYDVFGLENGYGILHQYFNHIENIHYDDYLLVDNAQDIIQYILSCHGNQSEYILKDYPKFEKYVSRKMKKPMHITKDAGLFICKK
ncbi:MAG: class I SAM-dependent methyltransferase, partial [Erysipelotrichaceae bacterium]|nr:class I SAM-dependent methyltransferase [Erysipelotrichaceae bacterium]